MGKIYKRATYKKYVFTVTQENHLCRNVMQVGDRVSVL